MRLRKIPNSRFVAYQFVPKKQKIMSDWVVNGDVPWT